METLSQMHALCMSHNKDWRAICDLQSTSSSHASTAIHPQEMLAQLAG